MPRAPRADEAGGLYHVLNRGNLRADIFRKEEDLAKRVGLNVPSDWLAPEICWPP